LLSVIFLPVTSEPEKSASASGPSLQLKVSYLLVVLAALFMTASLIFEWFGQPHSAVGDRILAGLGGPSIALLLWPWPKSFTHALHVARVVSGVAFGSAIFALPLVLDHGDERRQVNVGLLTVALLLHGLVILVATEYLRSADDNDQKELVVTCREVLQRVERLEGKLEERDRALAAEVRAMAAAVDRLERTGSAKQSWVDRLRQLL
jgi:hypothetical protein